MCLCNPNKMNRTHGDKGAHSYTICLQRHWVLHSVVHTRSELEIDGQDKALTLLHHHTPGQSVAVLIGLSVSERCKNCLIPTSEKAPRGEGFQMMFDDPTSTSFEAC